MKQITIGNICIALALVFSSMFISGNSDLYSNVILFIGAFIILCIFSWFMELMIPKYITKEIDETAHPVIETQTILHICNIEKHYGKSFYPKHVEKCECGSTLFRIYNEDTEKGTYIQHICAKCNIKSTGIEFSWKQKV